MKVFIRTDANEEIGTGHLIRCIHLAQAFLNKGVKIQFIFNKSDHAIVQNKIGDRFEYRFLDNALNEIDEIVYLLSSEKPPVALITDIDEAMYYRQDSQKRIMEAGVKLIMIAFYADKYYLCDAIINMNIRAKSLSYNVGPSTEVFLGSDYIILDPIYKDYQTSYAPLFNSKDDNLLVFFGGSDSNNRTGVILDYLFNSKIDFNEIDVVLGAANMRFDELRKHRIFETNASIHFDVDYFPELILKAKYGFVASGTVIWEMAVLQTLGILIPFSNREIITAEYLEQHDLAFNLGTVEDLDFEKFEEKMSLILSKEDNIQRTRNFARQINHKGTERISEVVINQLKS